VSKNAWHFCNVLPCINDLDPIKIVKPICLQMGWTESPASDVTQEYVEEVKQLPEHPVKSLCNPEDITKVTVEESNIKRNHLSHGGVHG